MRKASIDIGSNSILLLAAEIGKEVDILLNESHVTGLGRDLDLNQEFIEVAMDESFKVLKSYVKACQGIGIQASSIIATATEASRVAKNANAFFTKVLRELGLRIIILTGSGEAFYSTKGILFDRSITENEITIMDIGGASTELIKVSPKSENIITSFSMPIGAVRMNNWRNDNKTKERMTSVFSDFEKELTSVQAKKLYCVAGTMTSVGNMYLKNETFIEDAVNGLSMTSDDVFELFNKYSNESSENLLMKYPFLGKRSVTINSGLELACGVLEKLKVEDIVISTYGLRYGTLITDQVESQYIWKQF